MCYSALHNGFCLENTLFSDGYFPNTAHDNAPQPGAARDHTLYSISSVKPLGDLIISMSAKTLLFQWRQQKHE